MAKKISVFVEQLKQSCKIANAGWAAFVFRPTLDWELSVAYGLSKARQVALADFMAATKTAKWLTQAEQGTSVRYRGLKAGQDVLSCQRVYALPVPSGVGVLLVGIDQLDKTARQIFKMILMSAPLVDMALLPEELPPMAEIEQQEIGLYLTGGLQRVLDILVQAIPSEYAYLTVRAGDVFRIDVVHNLSTELIGKRHDLQRSKPLAKIVKTRTGVLLSSKQAIKALPLEERTPRDGHWLLTPIVLSKRVIGYIAYSQKEKYNKEILQEAMILSQHVAPSVEKAIGFVEAARYLRRFALLNELAAVATVEINVQEFLRRVRTMVRRSFRTDRVAVLFLDETGKELVESQDEGDSASWPRYSLSSSLEGTVVRVGQPIRLDNIAKQSQYAAKDPEIVSKVAVPLRAHGRVIGALTLESTKDGAFDRNDENLLLVIASQVANILENVRLQDETRQRADYLMQINEIVQSVLGLNEIDLIADLVAELMAERFGYELVMVMLLEEEMEELVALGIAGSATEGFPSGLRYAKNLGAPGEVLRFGKSILRQSISSGSWEDLIPGWQPGSVMCVPLQDGDRVFGVIDVEYAASNAVTESDLLVLEALAGVLSSVMMYAQRYGQLQNNIRQLEAVRGTALDISHDLDLDILIRRVVTRVKDLVGARGAELGLVESDQEVVKVLVSDNPWQDYTGYIFPYKTGVTGQVAAAGKPLVIADYNAWSGKTSLDFQAPFTTVAGVPLKLSDEVIGTLTIQDDRPSRSFGPQDVRMLELLAPQLAVFIRNARLYQELEERIEAQELAESRLVRSAKLAAVGEMAAGVAHELNNPLTTVTGFAELILEALAEDSPEHEDMQLVLKEAHRARTVVRRLLDFSRQSELLRVETDINELVGDVLALVHHLAQTSGVEVRLEFWDGLPVVRVERNQIQQVFLNLIHNAIHAMPDGGRLILQTQLAERKGEAWVGIQVEDTGTGIAPENLEIIFEPFFTTKPSGQGTGLGLSVSYGIVSDHGGYIDVASEIDVGTVFTVWLPVRASAGQEREQIDG